MPGGSGPPAVPGDRCPVSSGGLAEEVDEKVLHAAFIPFGDITDIQIPLDYETGAWPGGDTGHAGPGVRAAGDRRFLSLQKSTGDSPSLSSSWPR